MFHSQILRRLSRSEPDETFYNPVLTGFNPDPSVIRVNKDYFLATSSFEFFPGVPIYHSTDLIQWTLIGHALTRKSQLDIKTPQPGGGVWAPTLRYHEGWFYMTTCCWDRYNPQNDERAWPRGFYVKTNNIWNSDSWSEPIYFDQPGFDQDLFWGEDNKVYLSTTHRVVDSPPDSKLKNLGVHICTVDLKTGNSTSIPKLIRQSATGIAEGSHVIKRDKYHYLFVAEGGTEGGHSECVYRTEKFPVGPWEECPQNPVLKATLDSSVQNTGHCDLIEDEDGRWWAMSLAVRPVQNGNLWKKSVHGRETFLMPVNWNSEDWPVFNRGNPLSLNSHARGLYVYDQPKRWRDDFDKPVLQLGWYWKNTPVKPEAQYDLDAQSGRLRLWGGPFNLSSVASPTALFRKQNHREGLWRTRLSFSPESQRTEAGTVVYWNYTTYSSIGIRSTKDGTREIVFTDVHGRRSQYPLETNDTDVILLVDCQASKYRFGYDELTPVPKSEGDKDKIQWIDEASAEVMTRQPPEGLDFTGMMLGLYAFGEMERCLVPADFQFAEFIAK